MKDSKIDISHDDLSLLGARWLRNNGFKHAFANMTSMYAGEQPDVLGVKGIETFLIEVKVSRSDFLADKKKPWRKDGAGLGDFRAYLVPQGLVKPEEVPYGWMLLECFGKSSLKVRVVKGRKNVKAVHNWIDSDGNERSSDCRVDKYFHTDKEEFYYFKTSSYSYKENGYLKAVVHWYQLMFDRMKESGIDVEAFANRKGLER